MLSRWKFYLMLGVFGLLSLAGVPELLAQGSDPPSVTFQPIVSFGDLFTSITATVGPIVCGALILGLSIWGARYVFSVIKSMGR